jgi:hypothetical protein
VNRRRERRKVKGEKATTSSASNIYKTDHSAGTLVGRGSGSSLCQSQGRYVHAVPDLQRLQVAEPCPVRNQNRKASPI